MRATLAWRISSAYLILILAILLAVALYAGSLLRSNYLDQLEERLGAEASIAAGEAQPLLAAEPLADLQPLALRMGANSGARMTLMAPNGVVLGDSEVAPAQLENHANRPEIIEALGGGRGVSVRPSVSVGRDLLYVAVPIRADAQVIGVARTSLPVAAVESGAAGLVGALALAVGVAACAATALALWLGRSTTEPIKQLTTLAGAMAGGRLDSRLTVSSRDEVGALGLAFNQMADRIQDSFATLSSERNRLAAILQTMADGLVITSPDGVVLLMNSAAERLLRVRAELAAGQTFITVARDHELAALLDRPDGSSRLIVLGWPNRQVRALSAMIPGSSGQRLLLLQDVTELRRLETVRRDFVANVSHELRTPLAAIKAVIETLEDGALRDRAAARTFLGRMHGEVDKLTELVRELLELSRIESGQARINPVPSDLRPLLHSATDRLSPLASRGGLGLKLTIEADLPPALADPERVSQVVASLLHNAIKFTEGGGQVELRAETLGEELAVRVLDSGIGVPPADLERIFERFYKTDRSRSSGGTGLGLAIAKHLVEAHGGRIWAESAGSRGTTFTFTLPRAPSSEQAEDEAEPIGATWRRS